MLQREQLRQGTKLVVPNDPNRVGLQGRIRLLIENATTQFLPLGFISTINKEKTLFFLSFPCFKMLKINALLYKTLPEIVAAD